MVKKHGRLKREVNLHQRHENAIQKATEQAKSVFPYLYSGEIPPTNHSKNIELAF